jgi:hypothetical protein
MLTTTSLLVIDRLATNGACQKTHQPFATALPCEFHSDPDGAVSGAAFNCRNVCRPDLSVDFSETQTRASQFAPASDSLPICVILSSQVNCLNRKPLAVEWNGEEFSVLTNLDTSTTNHRRVARAGHRHSVKNDVAKIDHAFEESANRRHILTNKEPRRCLSATPT